MDFKELIIAGLFIFLLTGDFIISKLLDVNINLVVSAQAVYFCLLILYNQEKK